MNEIDMLHHVVAVNERNLSKSELYELNIHLYIYYDQSYTK